MQPPSASAVRAGGFGRQPLDRRRQSWRRRVISANGGPPNRADSAGGGGGRVAVYLASAHPACGAVLPQVVALGGLGGVPERRRGHGLWSAPPAAKSLTVSNEGLLGQTTDFSGAVDFTDTQLIVGNAGVVLSPRR